MAHRQFQLNEGQQRELEAAEQQVKKVSALKRIMAVRMYGEGNATAEIEGLLDQRQGGNRAKLSAEQRAKVNYHRHRRW